MRHQFHKYNVSPKDQRTVDGITFDSKREAARYLELKAAREAGSVVQFITQAPSFRLPGGVRYVCDFLVFWADGTVTFEDVKGMRTASYKAKKKMVEELYSPIQITEVS